MEQGTEECSKINDHRPRSFWNLLHPPFHVGECVLVGVTYDADTKEHTCQIERIELNGGQPQAHSELDGAMTTQTASELA